MNISNILSEIEKTDPEVYQEVSERRDVLAKWGKRAALTALPFVVGSFFKRAYGKTTSSVVGALNFALTLEYLEASFYSTAINHTGLIPAGMPLTTIQQIAQDEADHVSYLQSVITNLGGTPVFVPPFDYTGGGAFPDVFTNYTTFLEVAQTFEDTGVRAYKGQVPGLTSDRDLVTQALRIHSVEARHAAQIRIMRNILPWVVGNQSGIGNPASQATYNGEQNTFQANIDLTTFASTNTASESFDEPLDLTQVLQIVSPFIL